MGATTAIEWCNATFNPWWGCSKISPACDHCYAEAWANRFGKWWGLNAPRRLFSGAHWRQPLQWNKKAEKEGTQPRVFCASMADVFDNHPAITGEREKLWELIRATPCLDWLLLTKRIGNAAKMLPADWGTTGYRNVWLGATIANQEEADRDIPKLLATPARVRFLSCEPLLGEVNLRSLPVNEAFRSAWGISDEHRWFDATHPFAPWKLHWVIVGGESGRKARPMPLDWMRRIVRDCKETRTAVFCKQLGSVWAKENEADGKGGDMSLWPLELRYREFPIVSNSN